MQSDEVGGLDRNSSSGRFSSWWAYQSQVGQPGGVGQQIASAKGSPGALADTRVDEVASVWAGTALRAGSPVGGPSESGRVSCAAHESRRWAGSSAVLGQVQIQPGQVWAVDQKFRAQVLQLVGLQSQVGQLGRMVQEMGRQFGLPGEQKGSDAAGEGQRPGSPWAGLPIGECPVTSRVKWGA